MSKLYEEGAAEICAGGKLLCVTIQWFVCMLDSLIT